MRKLKYLSLRNLQGRLGHREGSTTREEMLLWLVPDPNMVTLQCFTCVLSDMYVAPAWE
jgi:hypothetical protein